MFTTKDRLKQVMDTMGLKPLTPATTCKGITKNMMQKLWKQNTTGAVSSRILEPFCKTYPQVNCNFIIRGTGPMFLDEPKHEDAKDEKMKILESKISLMGGSEEERIKTFDLVISLLDAIGKTYGPIGSV